MGVSIGVTYIGVARNMTAPQSGIQTICPFSFRRFPSISSVPVPVNIDSKITFNPIK